MPTTYILKDTDEAQGWTSTPVHENKMETTTATAVIETVSIPLVTASTRHWSFIAPEGAGTTDWTVGAAVTIGLDVTTAAADVGYTIATWRVTADGNTSRGQGTAAPVPQYGTGLKTFSGTFNLAALNADASRAASDRFAVTVSGQNDNMMLAQNLALRLNTADAYATVYWTVAAAAASLPPVTHARRRQYRIAR